MNIRLRRKLVCGIGVNDHEGCVSVDGKLIPSYVAWHNMVERCYSNKCQANKPTYIGCSVCSEWVYFTNFKQWYDKKHVQGWALDKDLLVQGNKIYSPETCTYVPQALNKLFTDCAASRGEYPQGVSWHKLSGKFRAYLSINGVVKNLGLFSTPQEASEVYQSARLSYVLSEFARYRELYSDNKPLMHLIDVMEHRK